MRIFNLLVALFVAALASGCASITSSDMQSLSITTHSSQGEPVDKVKCTLKNDKGGWQAEAPAFVDVRRSSEDLTIECKKDGQPDGFLRAISRAAGGMFGNIIFGGGIGAIVDHARGTGYNYPEKLPVQMGKSITVDRREEQKAPGDSVQQSPSQ